MMPGKFEYQDMSAIGDRGLNDANNGADERLLTALAAIKQIAHVNEGTCGICDPALAAIVTRDAS